MISLVEPWKNIGIYDSQLSKIEKLKNNKKNHQSQYHGITKKIILKKLWLKKGYFLYFV